MRIFYDSTIDSLYFDLSERPSVRSDEVNNGVVLDYDENRILVGIDVQNTNQRTHFSKHAISHLPLSELLAT